MARSRLALTLATILGIVAGDRAFAQAVPPASPSSPPDPSAVLLPPVVSGPVLDRPSDVRPSDAEAALPAREPAARIALDATQYTPVRSTEYEDSRRTALARPQAEESADDALAYLTEGRYRRGTGGLATRSRWEEGGTRRENEGFFAGLWHKWFGRGDDGRTPGERFGDRVDDAMNGGRGDVEHRWFESDKAFCDFVSPLSNPFFFEDPRSLTEVRGNLFYQSIPDSGGDFRGGYAAFFGGSGRLAFTQRISLVVHKIGVVGFHPGDGSIFQGGRGLSELWIGPKVVVYRDPETKSLISLGTQFQIPLGGEAPLQDTGRLSVVPYVSAAQKLLSTEIGTLNGMASTGYSFSTNRDRSDFYYLSAHLDFDIANGHRFYPVAELNWFSYTTDGQQRPGVTTEGRDFANVGAASKGANLVTWALGLRWKSLNGRWEIGGGYEGRAFGQRGMFDGRVMLDVIWRF